jgi:glycogen operon protein
VKLIAEPWDVGPGGYQVGNFPPLWTEWNGKYRDAVRDFWRGSSRTMPEFASRLTGSSDLYATSGRRPVASINFVTCHDGFTLTDLVSYNRKHNEANGEDNRDGSDDNRSWNCGAEGPVEDPAIVRLRRRQQRNFLATLFVSQGVPMMTAGDEIGRTQHGNNNAYCQDNEVSWVDWSLIKTETDLLNFVRTLAKFRRDHPVLRRRRFFLGKADKEGSRDIVWLTPSGKEMADSDWHTGYAKSLGVYVNGDAISEPGQRGEKIYDDSFLMLINAHHENLTFTLPGPEYAPGWLPVLDTADETAREDIYPDDAWPSRAEIAVTARSLQILIAATR